MSPQSPGIRKFEALCAACCDPRLARGDLAVLAVILQHANNQTGKAWPGVNRIAAVANIDRSSAMRSIAKLERAGLVEVDRSKRGRSNTYRPRTPTSGADATSRTGATSGAGATELVAPMQPQLVAPMQLELRKSELRKEPRKSPRASALDEQGFAEFWSAYPKKIEKADAAKVWRKLNTADRAAAIADVKRRSAGEWVAKDTTYIVGAPRYLRGRRWEDEQAPKAVPQAGSRADRLHRDFTNTDYTAGLQEEAD